MIVLITSDKGVAINSTNNNNLLHGATLALFEGDRGVPQFPSGGGLTSTWTQTAS